jgi:UDP:flavonoid glycosyltransferase YjiC (YdhE family)
VTALLYAWEFGSAFGHIGAFLPLGQRLRDSGHDVRFAIAQVASAATLLGKQGFAWLQSPVAPELRLDRPPLSYADILLRFGYADPTSLMGLTVAWRELIRLTGTRLVLPDHAPTAILAARTLGVPILTYSYGFCVPPALSPTPNMRPWLNVDPAPLLEAERVVLGSMNSVLANFDCPPLDSVAELFGVQEPSLMTFPELDHYAHCRGPATYWGCLVSSISGVAPDWPSGSGPRVFAYLRREIRHAEALLAALGELGYPSLVVFPDIPDDMLARCHHPNVTISRVPLDTSAVLAQADVAVTYGGHGLTTAFLLAGKPLLLLPGQLEQFMLALRIEEIGAGLLADPEKPATDIAQKLRRVATEPFFAGNAQAFARKYAAFPQEVVVANLVRRIEELTQ